MVKGHRPELERYEIIKRIGQGGFGVVYQAKQRTTGQLCAIKMIDFDPDLDEETRQVNLGRFEREMALIGQLRSPYIVRLFDSGVYDEAPYMVLEYIEGETLSDYIYRKGALSEQVTTRLITQCLEAMSEAHSKNIIHRDLKPDNIMVMDGDGQAHVKILDFGIARLESGVAQARKITVDGQIWGTPSYMAPELLRGEYKAHAESDVYALGLITLECLTGATVIAGEDIKEVCIRQIFDPIFAPEIYSDTPLGMVAEKACQKEMTDRFANARAMLDALENPEEIRGAVMSFRQSVDEVSLLPDSALEVIVDPGSARRQQGFMLIAALLLPLLIAVVLVPLFSDDDSPEQASATPSAPPAQPVAVVEPPPQPDIVQPSIQTSDALIAQLLTEAEGLREKEPEQALEIYRRVLEIEPENSKALEGAGWSLLVLKRFKEAIAVFNVAIKSGFASEGLLLGVAIAYESNEQLAEARDAYLVFVEKYPASDKAERVTEQIAKIERDLPPEALKPPEETIPPEEITPPEEVTPPKETAAERKKRVDAERRRRRRERERLKAEKDNQVVRPPVFPDEESK